MGNEDFETGLLAKAVLTARMSRVRQIEAAYNGQMPGGGVFKAKYVRLNSKGQHVVSIGGREVEVPYGPNDRHGKAGSTVSLRVTAGYAAVVY